MLPVNTTIISLASYYVVVLLEQLSYLLNRYVSSTLLSFFNAFIGKR